MASSLPADSPQTHTFEAQTDLWASIDADSADSIKAILQRDTPWKGIERVPARAAAAVMDRLQSEVDKLSVDDSERRKKYIKCLQGLSKQYDILPTQLYIPKAALQHREEDYSRGGAFADVYKGKIHGHPHPVCLKRLRNCRQDGKRIDTKNLIKAFCKEVLSWRQVSHENILPFYGVSDDMFGKDQLWLCFISPWMENGTIPDFLGKYPQHDRLGWVWDISAGLDYLHQLDPCIVHKDIRGVNLLVGDDLRCYLVDFGISIVSATLRPGTGTRGAGATRWSPPEVIKNECQTDDDSLRKVDIYSFGCTIIEMYTRDQPYANLRTDAAVIYEVMNSNPPSPPSPDVLPPDLWESVVIKALSPVPADRPSAADIKAALEHLYGKDIEKYLKDTRKKSLKGVLEWGRAPTSS